MCPNAGAVGLGFHFHCLCTKPVKNLKLENTTSSVNKYLVVDQKYIYKRNLGEWRLTLLTSKF